MSVPGKPGWEEEQRDKARPPPHLEVLPDEPLLDQAGELIRELGELQPSDRQEVTYLRHDPEGKRILIVTLLYHYLETIGDADYYVRGDAESEDREIRDINIALELISSPGDEIEDPGADYLEGYLNPYLLDPPMG